MSAQIHQLRHAALNLSTALGGATGAPAFWGGAGPRFSLMAAAREVSPVTLPAPIPPAQRSGAEASQYISSTLIE